MKNKTLISLLVFAVSATVLAATFTVFSDPENSSDVTQATHQSGDVDWVNYANAEGANDGNFASITLPTTGAGITQPYHSHYLVCKDFNFDFDNDDTVVGIQVSVNGYANQSGLSAEGAQVKVQLIDPNSSNTPDTKSVTGIPILTSGTSTSLATWTIPSETDKKWQGAGGHPSWWIDSSTPLASELNDAGFGFKLWLLYDNEVVTTYIDSVVVTVYYTSATEPNRVLKRTRVAKSMVPGASR